MKVFEEVYKKNKITDCTHVKMEEFKIETGDWPHRPVHWINSLNNNDIFINKTNFKYLP